jgi:hypothetical protein
MSAHGASDPEVVGAPNIANPTRLGKMPVKRPSRDITEYFTPAAKRKHTTNPSLSFDGAADSDVDTDCVTTSSRDIHESEGRDIEEDDGPVLRSRRQRPARPAAAQSLGSSDDASEYIDDTLDEGGDAIGYSCVRRRPLCDTGAN